MIESVIFERGDILVKPQELTRHQVIERCLLGKLTNQETGELLNLSIRQVQRFKKRVGVVGILGVVHRNRGKEPVNKLKPEIREKIVEFVLGPWDGMNTLHVQDKLKEAHGIVVSHETIRSIFKQLSIPRRKHKTSKRFMRRERKPMAGMLVQSDGSPHDWFSTGEKCTLIAAVDDANSEILWAEFFDFETSLNYMVVFMRIVERKGIFCAVYVDRHSCFKTLRRDFTNRKTFRRDDFEETQVARALSELGIEMIHAHTPQAKGRIERYNQTFQDRLFYEMKLRGIKDKETANRYLHEEGLAYLNQRFMKTPTSPESAYRTVPKGVDLKEIFCLKFERQVQNDHIIGFEGQQYKILQDPYRASYARAKVEVRVYPDHSVKAFYQGRLLRTQNVTTPAATTPNCQISKIF